MQYLALQDPPHRHFHTLHARTMVSDEQYHHRGSDEPSGLPSMAAVCEFLESSLPPSTTPPSTPSPLPPPQPLPPSPATPALAPALMLHNPISSSLSSPLPPNALAPMRDPSDKDSPVRILPRLDSMDEHAGQRAAEIDSAKQNHHMRHSPPFQPGEQRPAQNALPSFSQLLQTVREPSPPRTPSRRTDSMEGSPVAPGTKFADVSWSEVKRRRTDTVADIHHRPSNASEYPEYDLRRPSSVAVDPALTSTTLSPHRSAPPSSMHPSAPAHYHRPSLPYPPHPPNPAAHARHRSSPVPHGHAPYHSQHAPSMIAPGHYPPAPLHHGVPYDHRPGYYPEPNAPQHGHPYDHRAPSHDAYYTRPTYPAPPHLGYENGYHHQQTQPYNYTFQSTSGVDNNAFNRKRRGNLPKEATGILKAWFAGHRESPYPTEDEKVQLCAQTGLTLNQVSNWFINARRRAPPKEPRESVGDEA